MKIALTDSFRKDASHLPVSIHKKIDRQLKFLAQNILHPGLRAKKIQGQSDIWEARVDRSYRFTFKIIADIIYLRRVGTHDKTLKNP